MGHHFVGLDMHRRTSHTSHTGTGAVQAVWLCITHFACHTNSVSTMHHILLCTSWAVIGCTTKNTHTKLPLLPDTFATGLTSSHPVSYFRQSNVSDGKQATTTCGIYKAHADCT